MGTHKLNMQDLPVSQVYEQPLLFRQQPVVENFSAKVNRKDSCIGFLGPTPLTAPTCSSISLFPEPVSYEKKTFMYSPSEDLNLVDEFALKKFNSEFMMDSWIDL